MLKKTAIALAVAGMIVPLASQAAGPTVYGKLFVGLDKSDNGSGASTTNQWDVSGFTSRLGIKGDEDLGGGLSAFYTFEFAVNADTADFGDTLKDADLNAGNRLSYAGLKSSLGSVSIGKQWSAYYDTVGTHSDPTYWVATAALGSLGYAVPYRIANSIKYSNDFGPVHLEADLIANNPKLATDTNSGLDRKAIGASFVGGPLTVAAAMDVTSKDAIGTTDDTKITGVAVAYDLKVVNIHAAIEKKDDGSASTTDTTTVYVGGNAGKFGYAVGYGIQKDDDTVGKQETTPWFYVTYAFSKNTKALLEYRQDSFDVGNDTSDTVLALMVDF